jgi:hypothetical protein
MDEDLGLLGGGKGETGEISQSLFARMGFSVGEGVGSGVVVCMSIVGTGGAGLCALKVSS